LYSKTPIGVLQDVHCTEIILESSSPFKLNSCTLKVRFSHLPHFVVAKPNMRISSCLLIRDLRESCWDLSTGFSGRLKPTKASETWRTRPSKTAYRLVIHPEQLANL
jgi:hypothetical protein